MSMKRIDNAIALLNQQENDIHHMGLIIDEYEKELKKKQEAVEPHYNARTNWYECGACHYSMTSGMHCRGELIPAYKVRFCAKCGQAVKWE
jgi:ribosomal protein S27AE